MALAAQIAQLIGGIGLFLIGMKLMTDGLKAAAGDRLRTILAGWTRTRLRGLAAGIGLTALVQSSTAVVVATIGFVNAGLLSLGEAIWVVFGSNVGTTTTGWLVALIGLKLEVDAYALPLIGIGMIVQVASRRESARAGAIGTAITGFGLFFLGIGVLAEAFGGLGSRFDPAGLVGDGWTARLVFIAIGVVLTLVTQSSSAAIAIILSSTVDGGVPFDLGASAVIGANVGTTSTAVFAAIGATPPAKRVAAAHILFNAVTAGVAVLMLSVLLLVVDEVREALGLNGDPATSLALFHTAFNILGIVVIWPVAGLMTRWLSRRFRSREEDESRPRYLDETVLGVPELALSSLILETRRLGQLASALAQNSCAPVTVRGGERALVVERLAGVIHRFIAEMNAGGMPDNVARAVPHVLRAIQHFEETAQLAAANADAFAAPIPAAVAEDVGAFRAQAREAIAEAEGAVVEPTTTEGAVRAAADVEGAYQSLKSLLLDSVAAGRVPVVAIDELMRRIDAIRRMAERMAKAARRLAAAEAEMTRSARDDSASADIPNTA